MRERLIRLWTDPLALDPAAESARVTRELAEKLGTLAKRLEARGNAPEAVAQFLMRCLFSMFAEDVRLIQDSQGGKPFTALLRGFRQNLPHLPAALSDFWRLMDRGGFDRALGTQVKRFNGELFADATALALDGEEADLLIVAAEADWSFVEPAIFGTLLERALDPKERHKLGAHFTPRAYVERLVLPTIIEPLREEWQAAQALAAGPLQREAELARTGAAPDAKPRRELREEAFGYVRDFHRRLCEIRVLDPACGSGNFLYVALEHMKRLEGEVLLEIEVYEGQQQLDMTGAYTVSPDQFLGIELNPRAAAIAEVVLWIGYLQWHFRTWGDADRLGEPILQRYHNIENKDAVLESFMGQDRMPEWPAADFIIGNPPFIGTARMRDALGDEYTERVRKLYSKTVPDSSDFVMYWWHRAAEVLRLSLKPSEHPLQRFGFITTNSIRQTFNRRVLQHHMEAKVNPISLVYAIPDHPWVDSADGAAVRVSMTAASDSGTGLLVETITESSGSPERVSLGEGEVGLILPDLSIGADTSRARSLASNDKMSNPGVKLHGKGFVLQENRALALIAKGPEYSKYIRKYRNGRDLTTSARGVYVIDAYGLTSDKFKSIIPEAYDIVLNLVKPERDTNNRESRRLNWWLFGETNPLLRDQTAGLPRYICTVETAKHRFFQFLPIDILPDNMLIVVASMHAHYLAVLSSTPHVWWALATGGRLGVGNDPRYNKTRCFETFPFPLPTPTQRDHLAVLGEELDGLRKRVLAEHAHLTMTKLYNVLEAVRAGQTLSPKDQQTYDDGLVGTLRSIHDDIDLWTARAYGWIDDHTTLADPVAAFLHDEQAILQRLVDLNAQRAADEKRGIIHYLRPEYQNPEGHTETQGELDTGKGSTPAVSSPTDLQRWKDLRTAERPAALRRVIAASEVPLSVEGIAAHFKGANRKAVADLVEGLALLGVVEEVDGGWVG